MEKGTFKTKIKINKKDFDNPELFKEKGGILVPVNLTFTCDADDDGFYYENKKVTFLKPYESYKGLVNKDILEDIFNDAIPGWEKVKSEEMKEETNKDEEKYWASPAGQKELKKMKEDDEKEYGVLPEEDFLYNEKTKKDLKNTVKSYLKK